MKKYMTIVFTIMIFNSCTQQKKIAPLSLNEIKNIREPEDLSPIELLSLAISVEEIQKIFNKRDSSVFVFKRQVRSRYWRHRLVITIDVIKDNWLKKEDVNFLIKHVESKEPAVPIYSTLKSLYSSEMTTLGASSLFFLSLYRGNRYLETNEFLLEHQDSLAKVYIDWWEKETLKKLN